MENHTICQGACFRTLPVEILVPRPRVHQRPAMIVNMTAALPHLRMPARIAVGDEDYATPVAMSQTLHRGIAGSTLTVIRNARHLTPLECPQQIAAELEKLIEAVPAQ